MYVIYIYDFFLHISMFRVKNYTERKIIEAFNCADRKCKLRRKQIKWYKGIVKEKSAFMNTIRVRRWKMVGH